MKEKACSSGWFLLATFALFATLKLTGAVSWSWLWVTAPLWLPSAGIFGLAVALILLGVVAVLAMLGLSVLCAYKGRAA